MTFLRIVIPIQLLFEHDLFGKPVSTFPDHALNQEARQPKPPARSDEPDQKHRNPRSPDRRARPRSRGTCKTGWSSSNAIFVVSIMPVVSASRSLPPDFDEICLACSQFATDLGAGLAAKVTS